MDVVGAPKALVWIGSLLWLIVKTALENGVTDPKQISYMLATAQHETRNFQAPEEDFGRSQARKL
ncbi:hypothetical protein GGR63_001171 [Xanthomonas sp. 3272]|nr:hypothetical protein [Xanthomonas arboricola]